MVDADLESALAQAQSRWILDRHIDRVFSDCLNDDLFWAIRPNWLRKYLPPLASIAERFEGINYIRRLALGGELLAKRLRRALRGSQIQSNRPPDKFSVSFSSGQLRAWTTENQKRALYGHDQFPRNPQVVEAEPNAACQLPPVLVKAIKSGCAELQVDWEPLLVATRRVQSLRKSIGRLLETIEPRMIITASTEHPFARLLVLEARLREISTVYIPHAPTALNRIYADIPQDNALLRGEADRRYYALLGAMPMGIQVVGDQTHQAFPPASEGDPIVVVAGTAERPASELEEHLAKLVAANVDALGAIVVAPHPRGVRRAEEAAGRLGLDVIDCRTADLLVQRNVVALFAERASGAILEAVASGVPSFRLSAGSNYLFEETLGIPTAVDHDSLSSLVSNLRVGDFNRSTYSAGALDYLHSTGRDARRNIEKALEAISRANNPVLDSWRMPFDVLAR